MRFGNPELCNGCGACWQCLFASLPKKALAELQSLVQVQSYSKGATIFRQTEQPKGVFVVRHGWVKLYHLQPSGRSATMNMASPPRLLGLAEVVAGFSYELSAVAFADSVLEFIPRHRFGAFLLQHPQMAVELLIKASEEVNRLTHELCESNDRLSPSERLLHVLQDLRDHGVGATPNSNRIGYRMTVQDLADQIGCSRQWTSKLLKELAKKGLILRRGQTIRLLSEDHSH